MDYSTNYYWRVRAINNNDTTDWSEKRYFITKVKVPNLLLPNNNSSNIPIGTKLIWNNDSSNYDCQISINSDFSSPVFTYSLKDTTFTPINIDTNTKYYWRVRAISKNINDTSCWSEAWSFTTASTSSIKLFNPEIFYKTGMNLTYYKLLKKSYVCINLFDLKGRMVYSFSDIKQSGTYFIKTHNISNGLYLLNLIIDDKKFNEKIMIK